MIYDEKKLSGVTDSYTEIVYRICVQIAYRIVIHFISAWLHPHEMSTTLITQSIEFVLHLIPHFNFKNVIDLALEFKMIIQ